MQQWQIMKNNLLPISNNGFRYIIYAFLASLLFEILDLGILAFFSFIVIFAIAYIFRNPEREVSIFDAGSVVSPVDGKVIAVKELFDSQYGYKVVVRSSYLDIGVLRAPCDGYITNVSTKDGARLSMESNLSQDLNAQIELVFKHEKHNKIKVKHIITRSFAPLLMTVFQAQSIRQSARYGFMLHGITEIYIPKNFRLSINNGSKLTASESLLGFFIAIP